MPQDPLALAHEWLKFDKNAETKAEVERLVAMNDISTLRKLMCSRMQFGTAGNFFPPNIIAPNGRSLFF